MFIIGFMDFFAQHRNIVGVSNAFFPSAALEMIGYLIMTLTASCLLRFIEKRMDGSDNYELVLADQATAAGNYSFPSKITPFDEQNREVVHMENEERLSEGRLGEERLNKEHNKEYAEQSGKEAR